MRASETVHEVTVKNRDRAKTHGKGRVEAIDTSDPNQAKYRVNGRWMPSLKVASIGQVGPYVLKPEPYFLGPFAGQ